MKFAHEVVDDVERAKPAPVGERGVPSRLVVTSECDRRPCRQRSPTPAVIVLARSAAMAMVGHQTEAIYRRYAITDEAMLKDAGEQLAAPAREGKWLSVFAKHVVHPERSGKNGVTTQPFNSEEAPDEAPS